MKAYSQDLREKVLRAVDQGKPRREIVNMFDVSLATLIPTCVLRDTSKMREGGHRTEAFRIGFQLIESVTYLVNHLIQRRKSEIRQMFFAHFFPYMFHGIQLWTVGRLTNQSHICRDLEIF